MTSWSIEAKGDLSADVGGLTTTAAIRQLNPRIVLANRMLVGLRVNMNSLPFPPVFTICFIRVELFTLWYAFTCNTRHLIHVLYTYVHRPHILLIYSRWPLSPPLLLPQTPSLFRQTASQQILPHGSPTDPPVLLLSPPTPPFAPLASHTALSHSLLSFSPLCLSSRCSMRTQLGG